MERMDVGYNISHFVSPISPVLLCCPDRRRGRYLAIMASTFCQAMNDQPDESPEPTAFGACRSAVAVHVASRRWLTYLR